MRWSAIVLLVIGTFAAVSATAEMTPVRIASKNFNESYILAEVIAQRLEADGIPIERRFGLGGTLICFDALAAGEIDLYVEYTGTLSQAILGSPGVTEIDALNALIADRGLAMLAPFGFNNTYAMATPRAVAEARALEKITDMAAHEDLKVVVSHEFLEREDGWPGLSVAYGLDLPVTGIEHGLAYQAIAEGSIDVTDAYSTDGELERYDLKVLADDLGYFPEYLAAPLVRTDLPAPVLDAVGSLAGRIDDARMQAMNSEVVFAKRSFASVANEFLVAEGLAEVRSETGGLIRALGRNTLQHLKLTATALISAVVFGIGLSLLVFRHPLVSRAVTYFCGLLQTVPSIALLALLIPLLGIGMAPAVLALFLYSLLPILRNTLTALTTIDPTLIRVAEAMGLTPGEQLRHVYLPLSTPSMFAGIRTAAVISIGTATLAAFIGAGGLGDPIVTGLALNDTNLILQGAIPAALLAILTELVFEGLERWLIPASLRD
ncbi:MAG: ABC transporter permease subunit [Gammaproteobacteria bacterium]|nr:MAG: ABC transporter permease subunit [Gammaproteobacteria bacterium]